MKSLGKAILCNIDKSSILNSGTVVKLFRYLQADMILNFPGVAFGIVFNGKIMCGTKSFGHLRIAPSFKYSYSNYLV